jgi:hypothetical protein
MERKARTIKVRDLRGQYADIEFPEYQREPNVWSREQKQRLIDSMFRRFDIASIYLYERDDGGLECIDGRQRLNAIMSFLGDNAVADEDNGFRLRINNEVADIDPPDLRLLSGHSFAELLEDGRSEFTEAANAFLGYEVATIFLSGSLAPEEFNLQFLRLNLGTLINAGEKLHAMVGKMRDLLFESNRIGHHQFLDRVGVPTRRYAREQVAAQILLQVFSLWEREEFARSRHFDLQKFLKTHAEVDPSDPRVLSVSRTLDILEEKIGDIGEQLRNRAITVSVVVAAVELRLYDDVDLADRFRDFLEMFLGRLRWQVRRMKQFDVDDRYDYLVEFQRHLTQAAVEKPAVSFRHRTIIREFDSWNRTGRLTGDARYEEEEGGPPPVA